MVVLAIAIVHGTFPSEKTDPEGSAFSGLNDGGPQHHGSDPQRFGRFLPFKPGEEDFDYISPRSDSVLTRPHSPRFRARSPAINGNGPLPR